MKKYLLIIIMFISTFNNAQYKPSEENLEAREWFQNAKFGLFIHWGVYSVLGDGEWVMNNQNISITIRRKFRSTRMVSKCKIWTLYSLGSI